MPTTESPLRYPGGKTQLAPFVVELLTTNQLLGGVYAEPFAGGAGLAWRLLLAGRVSEVWLNDIDPAVHALWASVIERPEQLCDRIASTPINMDEWARQRKAHDSPRSSLIDRGFAALFLNRTNRSGIILGGVIGGKDQQGDYKLDCRFNRTELIAKVRRIALYKDVIRLSNLDAAQCIRSWNKSLPKRALLNIDPPYYVQGKELYTNFYRPEDHAMLARLIRQLSCPWMLTYDDAPDVERLYAGLPVYRKSLMYSAQVKRRANELLVLSPRLKTPGSLIGL